MKKNIFIAILLVFVFFAVLIPTVSSNFDRSWFHCAYMELYEGDTIDFFQRGMEERIRESECVYYILEDEKEICNEIEISSRLCEWKVPKDGRYIFYILEQNGRKMYLNPYFRVYRPVS